MEAGLIMASKHLINITLIKASIEYGNEITSYLKEFRDKGKLPQGKAMPGSQGMEQ